MASTKVSAVPIERSLGEDPCTSNCALRTSEARLRDFAEVASDWLWETGPDRRFTYVSERVTEFIGKPSSWLVGRRYEDMCEPDRDQVAWARHLDDLDNRRPFTGFKCFGRDSTGSKRWFARSGKPIFDTDGAFLGYRGSAREITREVEAEEAIARSAAQLQLIADGLPAAISYIDDQYRFKFMNATQAAWYDVPADEVVGRRVADYVGEETFATFRQYMDVALSGECAEYETERFYPDGKCRIVNVKYVPHTGDKGVIESFFVLATDVTERRHAQAAQQESVRQLRLITDAAPALIAYCDRESRYTFANRTAAIYYNRPIEEIVGKRVHELIDEETIRKQRPFAERALAGEQVTFEGSRTFPDGQHRDYQTTYVPDVDATGAVRGFYLLLVDISERKRAEARVEAIATQLKLITDAMPAMIAHCDRDQRYRVVNRTMSQWLGRPEDEIVGRTPEQIFGRRAYARMRPMVELVLRGEPQRFETVRRFPDGRYRVLDMALVPATGETEGWYALGVDITEHRKSQSKVRRQKAELESLNRQKDRLLSIIAHDLRNAFNNVLGYSELLKLRADTADRETTARYADMTHEASLTAFRILDDLLQWSQAQMASTKAEIGEFSLNELVALLVAAAEPRAQQAELELVVDMPADLMVQADSSLTGTVLRNLIDNAMKFTPEGGQVTVRGQRDGETVRISVIDTGVGMNEDIRARVIDMDTETTTEGIRGEIGTGLGLQICKELLARCGSRLEVESAPGAGSTFSFDLPSPG